MDLVSDRFIVGQEMTFQPPGGESLIFLVVAVVLVPVAPYLTSLITLGLFFGIVVLSDGGLELALGYHAMSNLFTGLVANTESEAIASPSLFLIHVDRYLLFPNVLIDVLILVLAWRSSTTSTSG